MVTALLLAIAVVSVLFSILSLREMGELSNERMVAVMDANRILEEMRSTANSSLTTLRNRDWPAWAQTNVINPKTANGEYPLGQENVAVAFQNGTNPVQFTLTVTWQRGGHQYSHQVTTSMTSRSSA